MLGNYNKDEEQGNTVPFTGVGWEEAEGNYNTIK